MPVSIPFFNSNLLCSGVALGSPMSSELGLYDLCYIQGGRGGHGSLLALSYSEKLLSSLYAAFDVFNVSFGVEHC